MVIRSTLMLTRTPDLLRGRVNAVHYVFVGISNELGAFELGVAAALLSTVGAVVAGGIGTILVVGLVALLAPELRRLRRLDTHSEEITPALKRRPAPRKPAAPRSAPMPRPYVLINVAMTADGKLDTVERRGAAISSARDKARVDELRAAADAVMVGGHTLRDEDPRLTVKSADLRAARVARGLSENPAKVAVVSRPDLRPDFRFLTAGPARRILLTTAQAAPAQVAALREQGAEVYLLGETQVDLPAALPLLYELGVRRLWSKAARR